MGRQTALVRAEGRRLDRWERRGRVEMVWRRGEELDGRVWAADRANNEWADYWATDYRYAA